MWERRFQIFIKYRIHILNLLTLVLAAELLLVFKPVRAFASPRCDGVFSRSASTSKERPVYAVHVTRQFPLDGVLRMAGEPHGLVRPTIHFALEHMVYPHPWGNWESMPIAIIVPVKRLQKQLVNVNADDTFIVGDLQLPPGSVVLVREDVAVPLNFKVPVLRFSVTSPIRTAVESFLGVKTQEFKGTSEFWKSLGLEKYQIREELHSQTPFAILEEVLLDRMGPFLEKRSQDIFLSGEVEGLAQAQKALREIDGIVGALKLSGVARKSWSEKRQLAQEYIHLLEAENKLFIEHHKTLRPLIQIYGSELLRLSAQPAELWRFIQLHLNEWPLERSFR